MLELNLTITHSRRGVRVLSVVVASAVLMLGRTAPAQEEAEDEGAAPQEQAVDEAISIASPDPREEEGFYTDPGALLFGNMGPYRARMREMGITFDIQWTQTFQSVVDGGRDTGFAYGGGLDYIIDLNLGEMGILPGAFVNLMAESRYGESSNTDAGTIMPVNTDLGFPLTNEPDDNIAIAVTQLTYTQFLSEGFALFGGKFQTLDGDLNEFASGRGRSQFMNSAFVFNPIGLLTIPYSTLGFGAVILPSKNVVITTTVMNTIDSSTTTGFSDIGDGWTLATEFSFRHSLGEKPGGQIVTLIYAADGEFANLSKTNLLSEGELIGKDDDTWAITWSGWQYVYTPDGAPQRIDTGNGRPDVRGLGLFARVGFADEDTNPIDWTLSGGIGGRGLLFGRDDDAFGLGFSYADFESSLLLRAAGFEDEAWAVEGFYTFDFGRGLSLTADVQVLDPFSSATDTTTILGARFNVRF